jgi:carbonic anhydrase
MTASTDAAPDAVPDSLLEGAPPVDGEGEADPAKARTGTGDSGVTGRLAPIAPYLPGRREAIFLAGGLLLGGVAGGGAGYLGVQPHPVAAPPQRDDETEVTAKEAKERLEQGNARFVAGSPLHPDQAVGRREAVAQAQHPFAAVLSCADSRVPPEALFDQGLGDLFVVRSAGQVVDHAVLGSLQYGVEHLGVSLLVVLGHSSCGAVKATIEAAAGGRPSGTDVDALVAGVMPAVKEAKGLGAQGDELLDVSIQINVEHIVENLKQAKVIGEAASLREIKVVGGIYDLATGEVEWL